jgi:CRP-like cAMP-binding protein
MTTSTLPHLSSNNQLLSALSREDYTRLLPSLELVELSPGKVLYELTDIVRHSYFPLSGMVSLLALTEDGNTIEVAMIGSAGMAGLPAILGIHKTPYRVMVQIPGRAMKIRADALRKEFSRGERLHAMNFWPRLRKHWTV